MPSLRSSLCDYHARSTTLRHQSGQTRRLLQAGTGHGVTISCIAIPQPVQFSPSDGGNEVTACQSRELRWSRYWINAINRDDDGEEQEDGQDEEGEMEEEDGEIPSLKYRAVNDRTGGRLASKYGTQQIGDAEPANSTSREGGPEEPRGRVTAMHQKRMTVAANMGIGSNIKIGRQTRARGGGPLSLSGGCMNSTTMYPTAS